MASAILIALSSEPFTFRVLPWIALIPFFASLAWNRDRLMARIAEGLVLGAAMGGLLLLWQTGDPPPPNSDPASGPLSKISSIALLGLAFAAFAGISGPLLRRPVLGLTVGLPAAWGVLESTILLLDGAPLRDLAPILLATLVSPDRPEAQLAAILGTRGLGVVLAASSGLWLVGLSRGPAWRRLLAALLALALPYLAAATSREDSAPETHDSEISCLVLAQARPDPEGLARMTEYHAAGRLALAVWPPIVAGTRVESPKGSRAEGVPLRVLSSGTTELATAIEDPSDRSGGAALCLLGSGGLIAGRFWPGFLPSFEPSPPGPAIPVAIGNAEAFLSPGFVRNSVRNGARILILEARDEGLLGERAYEQRFRLERYRAIECGTWILRAGRAGAGIIDGRGEPVARVLFGLEGSAPADLTLTARLTPYATLGLGIDLAWWILFALVLWPSIRRPFT